MTVKVTPTVALDGVAPGAETVMVSVYVPAESEPTAGCTGMLPAPLPEVVESESHDCALAAVHVSVPPPVLAIAIDCAAGLLPPAVAVKDRVDGVTLSAGAAATVRVTPTVVGDPVAPAAVTTTFAE